ncbi:hypothetical protein OG785_07665 [Streptomyces sp. NBC_00006]|uniref:hypothetical protein n=1 Tax=Streptomyces sp. NBC_00006 TaxID=2975619 RepID=UPI002253B93D|nr:hypothetical protein [Streptomyces sp. NBC_00006]MCX5530432.1 hypothetical protein [Streptomyces sp. NBC_00006]
MQLRHKSLLSATLVTLALAAPARADALAESAPQTGGWQQVGDDATSGVSGLALSGRAAADGAVDALVVHDNKKPGQSRISRVTFHPSAPKDTKVTPVAWDGMEPKDLEAIEAVPGTDGEFMALASRGLVYRLHVDGNTARVLDLTPLPAIPEGADFEGFALGTAHGKTVAVWADRGAGADRPATVFAAPFSLNEYGEAEFGSVRKAEFRAAYPKGNVRHVSDISIAKSGRIMVSSASDAGDDGPFASAVSEAGRVSLNASGSAATLRIAAPRSAPDRFDGRKIEAVECLPGADGRALLGTDDENLGGFVKSASVCGG